MAWSSLALQLVFRFALAGSASREGGRMRFNLTR